jgi:hypothetical protein
MVSRSGTATSSVETALKKRLKRLRYNEGHDKRKDTSLDELNDFAKLCVGIFVGGLFIGAIGLGWIFILEPAFNQATYNNFNDSPQHVQAVAQKFSDDCLQLSQTTDTVSRKAIEQDIYGEAATVHLNLVDMTDGTRSCVNQAIADVTKEK